MKRILTGSRPSGSPHIGNFLGAFKPLLDYQREFETYFFLADFHAYNELPEPEELRAKSLDMIATLLAIGLDPQHCLLYSQSAVPESTELAWLLSCYAGYGAMQRSVAFKDAQAKGAEVNMGVFSYPILMAADILLYDADVVPVGQDQKQHVEIARDLAVRLNHHFEGLIKVPEPLIKEDVGLVPGTDGRKMSKSYNNVLSVFATDKQWKSQVMGITTDSKGLDEPKDPESCLVYQYYLLLATAEESRKMADALRAGGYGYGHAKLALLAKIKEIFEPMRERYFDLMKRPDDLQDVLLVGSKKVQIQAREKLQQIKKTMGFLV